MSRGSLMRLEWLLVLSLLAPAATFAKRAPPKEVPPIVHEGVEYRFPHFGSLKEEGQNGGIVEARDRKTGELLWRLKVYSPAREPGREGDVQDVFITSARLEGAKLVVTNERGATYEVDLATRAVRVLRDSRRELR